MSSTGGSAPRLEGDVLRAPGFEGDELNLPAPPIPGSEMLVTARVCTDPIQTCSMCSKTSSLRICPASTTELELSGALLETNGPPMPHPADPSPRLEVLPYAPPCPSGPVAGTGATLLFAASNALPLRNFNRAEDTLANLERRVSDIYLRHALDAKAKGRRRETRRGMRRRPVDEDERRHDTLLQTAMRGATGGR